MPFWPLCCESEAILFKTGHRAGVNFHPDYRDLGRKNQISVTGPALPHMNTSLFLQRKERRGEISETEPLRLENEFIFYKRNSRLCRSVRYAIGSKNVLKLNRPKYAATAPDSKWKYEKLAAVVHVP